MRLIDDSLLLHTATLLAVIAPIQPVAATASGHQESFYVSAYNHDYDHNSLANQKTKQSTSTELGLVRSEHLMTAPCPNRSTREGYDIRNTIHFSGGSSHESYGCIKPLAFASFMAFFAGFSDVICIRRFNCFVAMMSGNFVAVSLSLAERNWKLISWRFSLIGSYIMGVIGARLVDGLCQLAIERKFHFTALSHKIFIRSRLILGAVTAAIFSIADRSFSSNLYENNLALLAGGYGIVYTSSAQALNGTVTQLLTGHLTKLGIAVSDQIIAAEKQPSNGVVTSLCIISSFIAGGTLGATLDHIFELTTISPTNQMPTFTILGIFYAVIFAMS